MTLSPAFLDELRARTLLSSVIAPSVKLIRAGREWKACCPFHQEKTPSFTVNDHKGFYHCFGCGAHGDAIRFLTDARGLPFIEAVKELADKAGMELPTPSQRERERVQQGAVLRDAMAAAQRWFADQLASAEGGEARDYLRQRGIDQASIERFGLGLAPTSRTGLKRALERFGEEQLIEAGLLIRPEGGGDSYDRFRGRLMFPIRDPRGAVIAFGGRILGEGEPKYLNSPETVLFDKGRTLYNLDRASAAARASSRLLVVEGYMDVIALDQAGIGEVVAPLGTALTEGQLERLWRLDPAPLLCFDGDSAGQKAAMRAAVRALPLIAHDRTLRFVALPPGQDPDDLVRSGGREAFEALLAAPEALAERLWRNEAAAEPLTSPEARAALRQRLLGHAATIGAADLRDFYRRDFLDRLDALFARPPREPRWSRSSPGGARRTFHAPPPPASAAARSIGAGGIDHSTASAVLHSLPRFPQVLASQAETIAALPIARPALARLRDRLVDAALGGNVLDRETLATICEEARATPAGDRDLGFSFARSDDERARRDLVSAIEALAAEGEFVVALADATARLQAGDATAFDEQRRLHAAREEVTERLAALATSD